MKFITITFLAILTIITQSHVLAHDNENGKNIIHMENVENYNPTDIVVDQGDTIIFENTDSVGHWPASNIHPTHSLYPESNIDDCGTDHAKEMFDACKTIEPGESYSFKFEHPGEWRYHDHLSPNIKGTITVLSKEQPIKKESFFKHLASVMRNWYCKLPFIKECATTDLHEESKETKNKLENLEAGYDPDITEESEDIFNSKQTLYSYVKKFGAGKTTKRLNELSSKFGDCHTNAHETGRIAYELEGGKAFQECSAECHSGCYHGATEAFFRENGIENLEENLNLLCNSELNEFFSHQCIHGIGHGLMAWTDYDIHEALESCDLLPNNNASCYSGVFMENVVGGLSEEVGHFTEYLSDDPHMPCNVVEEKYVNSCYFYQTSRMINLFNGDFSRVSEECESIDPEYQYSCFGSMGRDVGGRNQGNPKGDIEISDHLPMILEIN